jgi:hypothetical protein
MTDEIKALKAERDALTDVVHRSGFRRCDIAACNCGSWHQVEGWPQRYREIQEATNDDYVNGETLLQRVERICAERDALKTELYIAVGMLSTQPDYSGNHPMDVLQIVKDVAIDAARGEP